MTSVGLITRQFLLSADKPGYSSFGTAGQSFNIFNGYRDGGASGTAEVTGGSWRVLDRMERLEPPEP